MLHGEGVERAFLILSPSTTIERAMIAERIREKKGSQEIEGIGTPGSKVRKHRNGVKERLRHTIPESEKRSIPRANAGKGARHKRSLFGLFNYKACGDI